MALPTRLRNGLISFPPFRLCIEHEPGYVNRMYEWYIGPVGFEYVDFIGRHETLVVDLARVLIHVGYTADLERLRQFAPLNVSTKFCGEPVWDPDFKRKILEPEAPAIRRFYPEWTHETVDITRSPRASSVPRPHFGQFTRRLLAKTQAGKWLRVDP